MAGAVLSPDRAVAFLEHMHQATSDADLSGAMEEIAEVVGQATRENFEQESDPDGNPWIQWVFRSLGAPANKKTLQSSRRLLASTQVGGPDHVQTIQKDGLVFGTAVPYAGTHQFGETVTTDVPLVSRSGFRLKAGSTLNIPARPFLGWTDEVLNEAAEIIGAHVMDEIERG